MTWMQTESGLFDFLEPRAADVHWGHVSTVATPKQVRDHTTPPEEDPTP